MSGVLEGLGGLASPWAYVVIGLLAAAEAAAFVGLFLPGEAAMLLGGFLAFQGRVGLGWMMAAGALGAVVGDSVGYQLGRVAGQPLKRSRLGRMVGQDRWARGEAYLRAKGGRAVFLGRFVGLLRAVVPALAGMSRMPYRTFLPWNVAGGVIWGPGIILLGYLAGGSYRQVGRLAGRASLLLLGAVVVVGGLVVVARWVARHPDRVRAAAGRQLARPALARLVGRYQAQLAWLAARFRPAGAFGLSLTVGLLLVGLAGWAFGAVAQDVLDRAESVRLDGPVLAWLAGHREAWLTALMRAVTVLGSGTMLVPLAVAVGLAVAARRRRWAPLGLLLGAYLGAALLRLAVRQLVERVRPPAALALVEVHSGVGFPSGHAAQAAAVSGMLAWLAAGAAGTWRWRVIAWTVAVLTSLLVGFSRAYLGVHWPTDVLGGWALGGLWLAVLLVAHTTLVRIRQRPAPRPPATPDRTVPTPGAAGASRNGQHRRRPGG
jgi:undecaprenyl-diphosphatase